MEENLASTTTWEQTSSFSVGFGATERIVVANVGREARATAENETAQIENSVEHIQERFQSERTRSGQPSLDALLAFYESFDAHAVAYDARLHASRWAAYNARMSTVSGFGLQ